MKTGFCRSAVSVTGLHSSRWGGGGGGDGREDRAGQVINLSLAPFMLRTIDGSTDISRLR